MSLIIYDIAQFVSLLLGLLADSILFLIFFKVPLVLNGVGLKFLLICAIMNAANTLGYLLFKATDVIYGEMCYIFGALLYYTLFSQLNWAIFYTFYIFRVICTKNQQNLLPVKIYVLIDFLISCSLTLGLIIIIIIDRGCSPNQNININHDLFIYISIVTGFYSSAVLISIYFAYLILKSLRNKFFEFKYKAFYSFCKMLWFPFIVLLTVAPLILLTLNIISNSWLYYGIIFFTNISGVYLLIGILVTNEFRDGIVII